LKLDAATSVTAPAASQPAPAAWETTEQAVSTTEKCWVVPNLSAPSAWDVKLWQSLNASAPRFEGPQSRSGHARRLKFSRVEPNLSAHLKDSSWRDQADRLRRALSASRTDRPVRGPMTTGLQHTLAATRASALRCCRLSRLRHADLTCAVYQGLALPQAARTSRLRGETSFRQAVFGLPANFGSHAALRSSTPPAPVAWTAQPSGSPKRQGLRMSRESSDSKRFPPDSQTSSL